VSSDLESKWREYFSDDEYERDRGRMVHQGWVIAETRTKPGRHSPFQGGDIGELVIAPFVWLFNKTQPREIVVVHWVRPKDAR
jgi:hypothetical protein